MEIKYTEEQIEEIQKIDVKEDDWDSSHIPYMSDEQLIRIIHNSIVDIQKGLIKNRSRVSQLKKQLETKSVNEFVNKYNVFDKIGRLFLNSILLEIKKRLEQKEFLKCADCNSYNLVKGSKEEFERVNAIVEHYFNNGNDKEEWNAKR